MLFTPLTMSDANDSNARKRTKLKCLVLGCNQIFDNDYHLSSNKKHYKGLLFKNIRAQYETLGTLENLFLIAAKQS